MRLGRSDYDVPCVCAQVGCSFNTICGWGSLEAVRISASEQNHVANETF